MPTSNRRLEANRRNAQLSTGPRTAAGKARVAQNRTTHALTGAHTLLPDEDPEAYARLLATLIDQHAPATETEDAGIDPSRVEDAVGGLQREARLGGKRGLGAARKSKWRPRHAIR